MAGLAGYATPHVAIPGFQLSAADVVLDGHSRCAAWLLLPDGDQHRATRNSLANHCEAGYHRRGDPRSGIRTAARSSHMLLNEALAGDLMPLVEPFLNEQGVPLGQVDVIKELDGGYSGAPVLLVDIVEAPRRRLRPGREVRGPSGQYVLKISPATAWSEHERPEHERHQYVTSIGGDFASTHVPTLVAGQRYSSGTVALYNLAGTALTQIQTVESAPGGVLEKTAARISADLLSRLNDGYTVRQRVAATDVLKQWLGYRAMPKSAPALHEYVRIHTGDSGAFPIGSRLYANPLWLVRSRTLANERSLVVFDGTAHGDLHLRNILVHRQAPGEVPYWLIDFALSRQMALFFDHAYLELAVILHCMPGATQHRLIAVMDELEHPHSNDSPVVSQDLGAVRCLEEIKDRCAEWQTEYEPTRADPVQAQYYLARVAAGLNWLNKPIDEVSRSLAFTYAAVAATRYVERFHERLWDQLIAQSRGTRWPEDADEPPPPAEAEWARLDTAIGGFTAVSRRYVLVAGATSYGPNASALGALPWSMVIDLDPRSDIEGLHRTAAPVLKQHRSLHNAGLNSQPIAFDRGTLWNFADGWPSHYEPATESLREWRHTYLPRVRERVQDLRKQVSPEPVVVVVITDHDSDPDKVDRVVETIDEGLRDLCVPILVTATGRRLAGVEHSTFRLDPPELTRCISDKYGRMPESLAAQLPGAEGPVTLDIAELRNLEEDLTVLHSSVLRDTGERTGSDDAFWRGTPPEWSDLHSGLDVERALYPALVTELRARLEDRRNYTVELPHSPGAGGTTLALRVAWDLRTSHPVVVIRRLSSVTLDRIDRLFHLVGRTVFVVVDASVIPSVVRDDMHRELANRNARAVMLYVRRTSQSRSSVLEGKPRFELLDPMSSAEATAFADAYAARTTDFEHREQLRDLARPDRPGGIAPAEWSPFFFGLIAFGEDFRGIPSYVAAHVAELDEPARDAAAFLALVTRYSQLGVHSAVIGLWLGVDAEDAVDGFGEAFSRLVVRDERDRLKVLHPLVAEELLRQLLGVGPGEAIGAYLGKVSIMVVQKLTSLLAPDEDELLDILEGLFIERDTWSSAGSASFSELIEAIRPRDRAYAVLAQLTERIPDEPHYWNHRGRFHAYELQEDFATAEGFLQRAVKMSDERDAVQFHTLGMVRRAWLASDMEELFRYGGTPAMADVLDVAQVRFDTAAEAFERARELRPDREHGYVSHLQMIGRVGERLRQAGGKEFDAALRGNTRIATWFRENVVVGEDLIARIQYARADAAASEFMRSAQRTMTTLCGDLDEVIAAWERSLSDGMDDRGLRDALVSAYLMRRDRAWSQLPQDELRRIVSLTEHEPPSNFRATMQWLDAYRRLPEFSFQRALERLGELATVHDSVRVWYWLYMLHFLRWRREDERDPSRMHAALDRSRQLASRESRRQFSYVLLATEPQRCPLVDHREMGDWDRSLRFYANPSKLELVEAVIDTVDSMQAGWLTLGQGVKAHFVPGTKYWKSRDIGAPVQAYVGFSMEGLRAWIPDAREGSDIQDTA